MPKESSEIKRQKQLQAQSARQERYELRKAGKLPPLQTCKSCGKTLKAGCGSGQAAGLGLCYECFKLTGTKKAADRRVYIARRDRTRNQAVWPVGYWSCKPSSDRLRQENLVKSDRLRAAIGHAYGGRPSPGQTPAETNGSVFVAWSDGRVTEHLGLNATNSKNITPEHWSALDSFPDDVGWFLDQIPPEKRHWFDWEASQDSESR